MKHFLCTTIIVLISIMQCSAQWIDDILGEGYEQLTITHDKEEGYPISTIIRKRAATKTASIGILYIHGYNDYFFQKEMGERFEQNDIAFYAIDLRNYGRSIRSKDKIFEVSDLHEYFSDINVAIDVMTKSGISTIILMGHSTGGLIATLYLQERNREVIAGVILNSPFLEWNMSPMMKDFVIPIIGSIGTIFPDLSFSQGNSTAYGESLHSSHHGEWQYNLDWKIMPSPKVKAKWLKAINDAHHIVEAGRKISTPILLMHSDKSIFGEKWDTTFQSGDAVLNVSDISTIGRKLGYTIREATVNDGLHDLLLSRLEVRNAVYDTIFKWIGEITALTRWQKTHQRCEPSDLAPTTTIVRDVLCDE